MIQDWVPQEDVTVANIYAYNIGTSKHIKQISKNIKGEIGSNTIIVEDFNTPLIPMNKSSRQEINEETLALNDTLYQINLVDIYRTFKPKTAEYTFFSSAHGTFSRREHMLSHKTSFNKFKKTEIISSILFNHNSMRLEINYKKKKLQKTQTRGG